MTYLRAESSPLSIIHCGGKFTAKSFKDKRHAFSLTKIYAEEFQTLGPATQKVRIYGP